jgi:hypothetical protein
MIDRRQRFAFLELILARSMSIEQAARRYGCHPRTIRHWCSKVSDAIPAKVAVQAFEDAKIKAAEVIRDGSAKVAHDLIASARKPVALQILERHCLISVDLPVPVFPMT